MTPPLILAPVQFDHSALDGVECGESLVEVHPPKWHVYIQGTSIDVYRSGLAAPTCRPEKRQPCGPWSYQSRKGLLLFLNSIDYSRVGKSLFVSLGYPDGIVKLPYTERSKHRYLFLRYVEKFVGRNVPCIWRIEWEERKSGAYTGKLAPHWHMMFMNLRWLDMDNIRLWWRKAIGADDGPLSTDVRRIRGERGVVRYLSKYVSKYCSLDLYTYHNSGIQFGRHWGCTRDELIPLSPVLVDRELTEEEIAVFKGFARSRWKRYEENNGGGFYLLGADHVKKFTSYLNRACKAPEGR